MSNERYMCPDPHGRSCGGTGWNYCAYWSCVLWATLQTVRHLTLYHEGTPRPVHITKLKPPDWGCAVGIKINGNGYDYGTLGTSS
jgi:hypothetical protein